MKYSLTIGDWSGDGHEKTQVFIVEIPDQFSAGLLKQNYEKNVELIGFDPTKLAEEYEDSIITNEDIYALAQTGFDFKQTLSTYGDYPIDVDENCINGPEGMVAILMHFIGHGLYDFHYAIVNENFPQLFGYWDSAVINSESIGYGLFY